MKNFLMIAPHFVPNKAVAAKRSLCFTRRLPEFGWQPSVVALPKNVQNDPALESLIPDVPYYRGYRGGLLAWFEDNIIPLFGGANDKAVSVTRPLMSTKEFNVKRGFIDNISHEISHLPFDRFAKYLPSAFWGSLKLLKNTNCKAIFATGGPFSTFNLATALSKYTKLPLILDLRDPYTVDPIYTSRWTKKGTLLAKNLEATWFKTARKVILNTEASYNAYVQAYDGIFSTDKFTYIRNHFDPELYDPLPKPNSEKKPFTIIFFGHLTPIRNSCLFLDAFRQFIDKEKLSHKDTKFITLGARTGDDNEQVIKLNLENYVEELPWRSFTKSRSLLGNCDLLLDLTSSEHYLRISGKFYDYLAAQKPILCISENPELKVIFEQTKVGQIVPNNVEIICNSLSNAYIDKKSGKKFAPDKTIIKTFEARPAAQKLAKILNEIVQ